MSDPLPGTPASGRRLGRYRLLHRVGEGGMGVVHLGLDSGGRAVAVKVLRPHVAGDPHARRRLAREVDTLQRVRHPRVAEVLDADVDCETPYVVTRYVPAPPLDAFVRDAGPLTGESLARLGDGLGEALATIHAAGVVHRDLKPGNVLMLDGDPVVIDFGIAHVADDVRLTSTGLVMGTPGYLSPEVVAGDPVSQATDWWGWAATMAFGATGRPPFGRGPIEVVLDRVRRGEADLDGVPAALVGALTRALQVEPGRRPAPGELRVAVADLRAAAATSLPAPPRPAGTVRPADSVHPDDAGELHEAVTMHVPAPSPGPRTTAVTVPPTRPVPQQPAPRRIAPHEPGPASTGPPPTVPVPAPLPPASPQEPVERAEPPALPVTARPRRTGTLAAALVTFAAVAAVAPVAAAILGFVATVLARTVDRSAGALLRRRHEHGPRRGDVAVATLTSPGHLLSAAVVSVPAALLPAAVGISTAFIAGWALGPNGTPAPGTSLPLALGAAAGVLTAWWGPGGRAVRRGSRAVVRRVAPGERGAQLSVALLALVTVAAALVVLDNGGQPDWTPLHGPPLGAIR
jgi:serine/threonine protein kinase